MRFSKMSLRIKNAVPKILEILFKRHENQSFFIHWGIDINFLSLVFYAKYVSIS